MKGQLYDQFAAEKTEAMALLMPHRQLLFRVLGISQNQNGRHYNKERTIRDALHRRVGGRAEVSTPFGNIDLLTADALYEVKELKSWKGAIGQALMYGCFYPLHRKVVYLFGARRPDNWDQMQNAAASYDVSLAFEETNLLSLSADPPSTIPTRIDFVEALRILAEHSNNLTIAKLWEQVESLLLDSLTIDELQALSNHTQYLIQTLEDNDK